MNCNGDNSPTRRDVRLVNETKHHLQDHAKIDIIPDIHGQLAKLQDLLRILGYREENGVWSHPERKVLFLGDYIDRGPQVRETLRLVRRMVEAGHAVALMGNHELNAVAFHTSGPDGYPLRAHSPQNLAQHRATLEDFAGRKNELADALEWFKGLPMFLELEGLRAAHACWSETDIAVLKDRSLRDREFLLAAMTRKDSPEHRAVENVLKGPEIRLPGGMTHKTDDGKTRTEMRVRWWGLDGGAKILGEIAMPPGKETSREIIPAESLAESPNLELGGKPVFFGHYWLPPEAPKEPLAPGICCLDFSAGKTGPLVAYRWDGENDLSGNKIITTNTKG